MHARHFGPLMGRFLSVDSRLSSSRTSFTPQRWNRYSYAASNPLALVDLNGRDISVPPIFQGKIDSARAQSPTFKSLFDRLNSDHRVRITIELASGRIANSRGIYSNPVISRGAGGGLVRLRGTVSVSTDANVQRDSAARVGHELAHYSEIIDTNKTLQERVEAKEKGVWGAGDKSYESQTAIDTEKQIRTEEDASRRPPGSVDFFENFQDLYAGVVVVDGIVLNLSAR
jgi:hypothetical protein